MNTVRAIRLLAVAVSGVCAGTYVPGMLPWELHVGKGIIVMSMIMAGIVLFRVKE
jgi:hypothetical protein